MAKSDGIKHNEVHQASIWDLPLRLFHWSFMICVIGAIISAKLDNMNAHERFGLAILGLVSFRILWGFIGSPTARFANFVKSPQAFWHGLRAMVKKPDQKHDSRDEPAGHNAVGGYATLALLFIPLMMALTGSFSSDDILYDGPFYHLMPQWAQQAGKMHHIGEKMIFLIILLHISALLFYYFRLRKNLVTPMVTGRALKAKHIAQAGTGGQLSPARTAVGVILLIGFVIMAQLATQLRPDYF